MYPSSLNLFPTLPSSFKRGIEYLKAHAEKGLKYVGAGVLINTIISRPVFRAIEANYDYCPTFPKYVYTYVRNLCLLREKIPGLSDIYSTGAFKGPIVEELLFRVALQEILLKRAPKAILNKVSPSHAKIIDTKVSKIARVLISSLAFSLAHAMPPGSGLANCSTVRLINTFVMGLIAGSIQEITSSPLLPICLHIGWNLQAAFFMEQTNMSGSCPQDSDNEAVDTDICHPYEEFFLNEDFLFYEDLEDICLPDGEYKYYWGF